MGPSGQSLCDLIACPSEIVRVRWAEKYYTGATFAGDVAHRAQRLRQRGVGAGDRVALFGVNNGPWLAEAFAVWSIGAVLVPVYPTSSAQQVAHILGDSGAKLCLADTAERCALAAATALAEPVSGPASAVEPVVVGGHDPATVIYTSGTTGTPKGCVLTHANLLAAAHGVNEVLAAALGPAGARAATQLFLPLSHSYGLASAIAFLAADVDLSLVADPNELIAQMPVARPTILMAVPRLLEKIRKAAGDRDPARLARDVLGGRLRYVVSGGAATDLSTVDYFASAGVEVLRAYGLTETAAAVSMSEPGHTRRGSVGRLIPGCTVTIADDGEILVRGPQVSPGYWPLSAPRQDPLPTGDLGRLDDDGYLYITGRRKEILVTSTGKNVFPTVLEDRIRLHPLVGNCMLVGDDRPFVGALITLDPAALAARPDLRDGGAPREDLIRKEIEQAVTEANTLVSRAESVREFRIVDGEFSVARGQLTPSLKLRRDVIARDYASDVDGIYDSTAR